MHVKNQGRYVQDFLNRPAAGSRHSRLTCFNSGVVSATVHITVKKPPLIYMNMYI